MLLAAVLAAAGAGASLSSPPARALGLPQVEAVSAGSVVDGIGLGVHMAYEDTPYVDASRVADALTDLGVRHVRDDLFLRDPEQYAALTTLAEAGIGIDLIMGRPSSSARSAEYVTTAATQLPAGAVESLEGPNEWDISGRAGWAEELRAFQSELFAAARANPATADLPVLAPALAFRRGYDTLGSMQGSSDVANGHLYTGGLPPSSQLDASLSQLRSVTGNQRVVYTETGYNNAVNTTSGHLPVPESVSATYMPRLVLEHASRGVERVYSYELIDEFEDPARTNIEASFGLLRRDWTPKPAYHALRNLVDLLEEPGAPEHAAAPLALSIDGGGSDVRRLLTQRLDGTYVLLLWRDVSIYHPSSRTLLPVVPSPVTVTLEDSASIDVHRPTGSSSALAHVEGTSTTVALDGDVVALVISKPGAVPSVPIPSASPTDPDASPTASPSVPLSTPPTDEPTTAPPTELPTTPPSDVPPSEGTPEPTGAPSPGDQPVEAVPAAVRDLRVVRRLGHWYAAWRAPDRTAGAAATVYRVRIAGKLRDVRHGTQRVRLPRSQRAMTVHVRAGNDAGWGPVRLLRVQLRR